MALQPMGHNQQRGSARDKNMLKEDFLPRVLGIVVARRGLTAFGIDPDTVGFAQFLSESWGHDGLADNARCQCLI